MPPDSLEDRARLRVGSVLRGKYRLDRVLGVGGMAVVYKATHRNQAEFAIKMLHPELSLSEDIRTRFLREGYAANSVRHPGVVRVVDDDVAEDGAAFLVMELLDGLPCDHLAGADRGVRVPTDLACSVAMELLDVLAAAHAQGIVHRDIKPANLFLLRDGAVKVLDFGIARVKDTMGSAGQRTGTGMLLGTPAFMAPEQALGKASDIDARADIWAVGATIFGLASGANVHEAETAPQLIVKLATEQARSLATVVPGTPPALVAIVDRALMREKEQRWPGAVEMRDALGWAMQETFGSVMPRAVIATAVAAQIGQAPPATTPWQGSGAAFPPTPQPGPHGSYSGAAAVARSGGGGGGVDVSTPPVVDTSSPVSSDRPKRGGGGSGKAVAVSVALIATAAAVAGAVFVLRANKAGTPRPVSGETTAASVAPVVRVVPPSVSAATAASAATKSDESERHGGADAAASEAMATGAGKQESPAKKEGLPHAQPAVHHGQTPAGQKAETSPASVPASPPTSHPAAAAEPTSKPSGGLLDGRR